MGTLRRFGRTLARFVALLIMLYGVWVFIINVGDVLSSQSGYDGWILAWILGSGLLGALGGLFYLVSYDGPQQFRNSRVRVLGWIGMLGGALVPSMLLPILVVLVLMVTPTLFDIQGSDDEGSAAVTSG